MVILNILPGTSSAGLPDGLTTGWNRSSLGALTGYFHEHPDVTGAELYAEAHSLAGDAGWLFGGAIAGHLVGEFPHARIPGDKDLYRISPANPTRMRDPDASGQDKYWIIEVHLVDRDRTFGGFYERLLVPRAQ
jgi:hypothetical protein